MPEPKTLRCTVREAVETLKSLWIVDEQGAYVLSSAVAGNLRMFDAGKCKPFRTSDTMQWSITENPLWDIVEWMPCGSDGLTMTLKPDGNHLALKPEWMSKLYELGLSRKVLCQTYAFSIISPADVEWVKRLTGDTGIIEINAGRGYWAWQLEQVGVNVAAYDPNPPGRGNEYFKSRGTFTTVMRRDHTAVELHPERTLLSVWPCYGEAYAAHALKAYRGDMVIFAGEGPGGCTADDEFFNVLESDWEWLSSSPGHATWWGIHCHLDAYVRKTKSLTT